MANEAVAKLDKSAKKAPIIIKKIKKGGHGGGHGGGWKVAYADFMTAMMCFFLVMWLMGSDEETLTAISHYFNHPNTPWQAGRDPSSEMVKALGDRTGVGNEILKGADGAVPDDLVKDPVQRVIEPPENKEIGELASELMDGQIYALDITVDYVKFSVPEDLLFKPGTAELHQGAFKYLDRLGQLFKGYKGYITIEGHADKSPQMSGSYTNAYEYTLARAVTVLNYLVDKNWITEERMMPIGSGSRHQISTNTTAEGRKMNRRVEFTLTYRRNR
ncbi:MAG TPA: hypothetical protein DCS07_10760 [Bdellovibrionales bacterium]|nr:MAG: hypothetical protein A2Z97_14205 [Bdellovibrionales bacterium GWB1_52_6]OFZ03279.1 MAG: hypothetical protein A2X97_10170 [Bdellovibrionales bacterium GWA1_52_35]OFZ40175.1 MAG: hypothetical protein A2070_11800 [Bdellovibrionales bacterium GWC1_52_8]HAR43090.1 hypothetical protein [Bdellovibrionales bacterium]